MSFIATLQKSLKTHHVLALVGVIVLAFAIYQYSSGKSTVSDGFEVGQRKERVMVGGEPVVPVPANPAGMNEEHASVSGLSTNTYGLAPQATAAMMDPADLLPRDTNSQWAQLNPAGQADFQNVNLLKAGFHIGIDTVGSSLRNANLQERSEPPNPTTPVSPWLNSTIEPDLMRRPLEIGAGGQ